MVDNYRQRHYRSKVEQIDKPTRTRRHSNVGPIVVGRIRLLLAVSWLIVFLFMRFSYANAIQTDEETSRQNGASIRSSAVPSRREPPDNNTPENLRRPRRFKRQYYEDGYYGNYYWQTGRVIGWFLGLIIFLMIICVPCICCIGIWFAGWFGFRQAMMARNTNRPPGRGGGGGAVSYTFGPSASPPPPPSSGAEVIEQHDSRVVRQQQYVDAPDSPPQHLPRNVNVVYEDRYNNDRYRSSSRHVSSPPPIPPYHHGQRHRRDSAEESREYYKETRRL